MFIKFTFNQKNDTFTIIDDDFVVEIQFYSIWEAIIDVYSKRNLDVWHNFAIAFFAYCKDVRGDVPHMLNYINNNLGINTDKLEKYLVLL